MTTYAKNDQGRMFLFMDGSADVCAPEIVYALCTSMAGWSKDFGEPTSVECPDPDNFGEFIEVDEIEGTEGRWTNSITSRMPLDEESAIRALARWKTAVDLHINFGIDGDPSNIANFYKTTVVENARLSNYSSTELVALESGGRAQITETVNISASKVYDIYPLRYTLQTAPSVAGTAKSVVIPPGITNNREGDAVFVLTAANLLFLVKGVLTTTIAMASNFKAVRLGDKIMVGVPSVGVNLVTWSYVAAASSSVAIAGIAATITAMAGGSQYAFMAAAKIIYRINSSGTVLSTDLSAIMTGATDTIVAISNGADAVVAVDSANRVYASYDDGATWSQAGTFTPAAGETVTAVFSKSEDNWLIGTSVGRIYCTVNAFATATTQLTASVAGAVTDIVGAGGSHVLYASIGAAIYRTVNGGSAWSLEPAKSGTTFPAVTSIADLDISPDNPNILGAVVVVAGNVRLVIGSV